MQDKAQALLAMLTPSFISLSLPAIAAVGITTLLLFLYVTRALGGSSSGVKRPPLVPSRWPLLGNVLQYAYNRIAFIRDCRERYGTVFRTSLANRQVIFMTSPSVIASLMRRSQQLSFMPIRALVHPRAFGMSMGAAISEDIDDQVYPVAFHPYYSKELMGATTTVFGPMLIDSLKTLINASGATFQVRLQDLIFPTFFRCSARTTFGAGFPVDAAFSDFLAYDEGFSMLASGLPQFLFPRAQRARDNLIAFIQGHLAAPRVAKSGDAAADTNLAYDTTTAMRQVGWSEKDTIGHMLAFLWGSQGNAMWLTFWCLSYVLADGERVARLKREINEGLQKECEGSIVRLVSGDPAMLDGDNFPLLESTMKEALRMCSDFIIARVAKEDTVFDSPEQGSFHVRKGEWVFGLPSFVHMDPEVHDSPTEFRIDRFVEEDGRTPRKFQKDGRRVDNSLMFWGGGGHVCRGRYVAEYDVKLFVLAVIHLLDPTPVGVVKRSDGSFVKDRLVPTRTEKHFGVLHSDEDVVVLCAPQVSTKY